MVTSFRQGCRPPPQGPVPSDSQPLSLRTTTLPARGHSVPMGRGLLSRPCVGGDARSLLRTRSDTAICDMVVCPGLWEDRPVGHILVLLLTCWAALDKSFLIPLSVCFLIGTASDVS